MTEVAASAAAQVAAAIAESAAYLIIFLLAFVLILLAWKLISHALDLVTRLPGLHFLNKTVRAQDGFCFKKAKNPFRAGIYGTRNGSFILSMAR